MSQDKYPECTLCTGNCEDEKIKLVFEDADFNKTFVNNMIDSKIDEVVNDCYLMAEVISEKTDPLEIADFAYCIYVSLSQLIEMNDQKRMDIAVVFRQEFDKMAGVASKERIVAKGSSGQADAKPASQDGWVDMAESEPVKLPAKKSAPKLAPPVPSVNSVASEEDEDGDFLSQLDADLAEIDEISEQINVMIEETPVEKPPGETQKVGLEPVIGKLSAKPVGGPASIPTSKFVSKELPPEGSKQNPIKLTPEMLKGIVSDKDLSRVDEGIKVKRVDIDKFSPRSKPQPRKKQVKPVPKPFTDMPLKQPGQKDGKISSELFNALEFMKTKDKEGPAPTIFDPVAARGETRKDVDTLLQDVVPEQEEKEEKEPSIESPFLNLDFGSKTEPNDGEKAEKSGLLFEDPLETQEKKIEEEKSDQNRPKKVCHNCKHVNDANNKFCNKCGYAF